MAKPMTQSGEELPPDNAARIVMYDAMAAATDDGDPLLDLQVLFERVIARLRLLVPRELHVHGEEPYVRSKVAACVADGILNVSGQLDLLRLGSKVPNIRYPDGTIRTYTAGLEPARERLDADEGRLRRGGFDIRHVVGSIANDRKSDRYRSLVISMREHGFLEYFPIIQSRSGADIDGVARRAAAAEVGLVLKKQHVVCLTPRRDTPLQTALLVMNLNADRLSGDERAKARDAIVARTGRPWLEIERDLALTREWRRVEPKEYDVKFDVKLVPLRPGGDASVQVTTDNSRVMLRSVTKAAGLPEWSRDHILPFIPHEEARTQHTGRKAIFVRIDEMIAGIDKMKAMRSEQHLKVEKAWDDVRSWLIGALPAATSAGETMASPEPADPRDTA